MNFEVTIEEANLIIAGLAELPFKLSAALVNKLQEQAKTQIQEEQPK